MTRQRHGDAPPRKKRASKKSARANPKSLLERAAAKRTLAAVKSMEPTLAPPSKNAERATEVVLVKPGEHPVDSLARDRDKQRRTGPVNPVMSIDRERSQFRRGPLGPETIDDVCRFLRAGLHRVIAERLLGLSEGRIKKWIRRGKESRENIEAWHESHGELTQEGASEAEFETLGPEPEFDVYATFHACVLEAEASGERQAVTGIINAALGAETPPDWKANAWLLSRRYGKRWGQYAERNPVEEEDQVSGGDGRQQSAVERLAGVLNTMFGRSLTEPDSDSLAE